MTRPLLAALLLMLALLVRFCVFTLVRIKGRSMLPTLSNGHFVLLWHTRHIRRGDVVICHYPNRWRGKRRLLRENFVKRVVALPGETIAIDAGTVLLNGLQLHEPYLDPARCRLPRSMPARTLADDEFFVLGDNRDASNDSRRVGPIPRRLMVGRVTHVLWPLRAIRRLR